MHCQQSADYAKVALSWQQRRNGKWAFSPPPHDKIAFASPIYLRAQGAVDPFADIALAPIFDVGEIVYIAGKVNALAANLGLILELHIG
jgi:hypothetical protein